MDPEPWLWSLLGADQVAEASLFLKNGASLRSEILPEKKAMLVVPLHGFGDRDVTALHAPLLKFEQMLLGIHVAVLAMVGEAKLPAQHAVRPHVASWTPAQNKAMLHLHDGFPVPPGVLESQRQAMLAEERVE